MLNNYYFIKFLLNSFLNCQPYTILAENRKSDEIFQISFSFVKILISTSINAMEFFNLIRA